MLAPSEVDTAETIWKFALRLYAQDGVEADCLVAQDRYGFDVTLLIFALFRARQGLGFDAPHAFELARTLTSQLVTPLRQKRRDWKASPPVEEQSLNAQLRAQLLAAELASEQTILQILHLSEIKGQPLSGYDGLIQCAHAARVPLDEALDALLKRLAQAGQTI